MKDEIWKDIPNYEGYYQVSNIGNVKSMTRLNYRGYLISEKILRTGNVYGYKYVILLKDRIRRIYRVHKLVAMAFLKHEPCGMRLVVNHINHDKSDNRLSNIEIITQRENASLKHIPSKSMYVGVTVNKSSFVAKIVINGKIKYLGSFQKEYDAHLAYESEKNKLKKQTV